VDSSGGAAAGETAASAKLARPDEAGATSMMRGSWGRSGERALAVSAAATVGDGGRGGRAGGGCSETIDGGRRPSGDADLLLGEIRAEIDGEFDGEVVANNDEIGADRDGDKGEGGRWPTGEGGGGCRMCGGEREPLLR
jgi:hypothetical protein